MNHHEVYESLIPSIKKVIKSNKLDDGLTMETNLFHVGLDSLGVMELLVEIENKFNIVFDDSELSPALFESLKCLVEKIASKSAIQ